MLGANVPAVGEVKAKEQVFQRELIHKVAQAMGIAFKSEVK
jgi:hypothetical protein